MEDIGKKAQDNELNIEKGQDLHRHRESSYQFPKLNLKRIKTRKNKRNDLWINNGFSYSEESERTMMDIITFSI